MLTRIDESGDVREHMMNKLFDTVDKLNEMNITINTDLRYE